MRRRVFPVLEKACIFNLRFVEEWRAMRAGRIEWMRRIQVRFESQIHFESIRLPLPVVTLPCPVPLCPVRNGSMPTHSLKSKENIINRFDGRQVRPICTFEGMKHGGEFIVRLLPAIDVTPTKWL